VALSDLHRIAVQATSDYHLNTVDIVHRVGRMQLTDTILVIVVGAAHRQEAFAACSWILEQIKEYVPIWKKDIANGQEKWHFHEK
jgi:molybdopterin synthase catalytic subunit